MVTSMDFFKELCVSMARDPDIMTFSDIATAASKGVVAGQKTTAGPVVGAFIGVSFEASKRAATMTLKLIDANLAEDKQLKPKNRF